MGKRGGMNTASSAAPTALPRARSAPCATGCGSPATLGHSGLCDGCWAEFRFSAEGARFGLTGLQRFVDDYARRRDAERRNGQ